MRLILTVAAFALLAACDRPGRDAQNRDTATANEESAPASEEKDSDGPAAAAPAAPPALPSRVSGGPDPAGEYFSERGGISRPLSGSEGGGAANRGTLANDLIGRWAFNCNSGVGPIAFRRGGRFTAPGGSGRFEANDSNFEVVFTFEDGETETWVASMEPGRLSLQRRGGGGSMSRRLCSATP